MNLDKKEHVHKICLELFQIIKNQENVEEEIFNILIHVSPYIGHLIPLPNDFLSANSSSLNLKSDEESNNVSYLKQLKFLIEKFEFHYVSKVRKALQFSPGLTENQNITNLKDFELDNFKLDVVCSYISKLQIVIGSKKVEEMFCSVVTKCMDSLLQQHNLYDSNAYSNLAKLSQQFSSLFLCAKIFVKRIIYILTCGQIFTLKQEKMAFVQETILEKLSVQLLTLSDSVNSSFKGFSKSKPSKNETSKNTKQKTKPLPASSESLSLSVEALVHFASIINEFLSLESFLEHSDILNISDYKSSSTKKGVLKHQSLELPDLIKTSHHPSVLHSPSKYYRWAWCEILQEFAPVLGNSMVSCFQTTCQTVLDEEKKNYRLNNSKSLKYAPSTFKRIEKTNVKAPKLCFHFIGRLLDLIVLLLPLSIIGGKHRFLSKLKTDYIDVINQVLKEVKPFVTDLIEDTPEKNSLTILPILLSSCQDIILTLQHCDQKLCQDHRLPFQGTLQLYKTICNHLEQFIVQYQKSRFSTVILHDAESNYWSDPRSFVEDDRCSYSVEMWQSTVLQIHQELLQAVNDQNTQNIASKIFCDSLCMLANRYCNCSPSYNRLNQVRRDIIQVLKFSFLFLWKIQSNPHDICPVQSFASLHSNDVTFNKIQVACIDLFTCLNILTAPLDCLHDIIAVLPTYERQGITLRPWLSFIDPAFFPVEWNGKPSGLTDAAFVCCILYQMQERNYINLILSVEAIIVREGLLLNQILKEKKELQCLKQALFRCLLLVEIFQEAVSWKSLIKNELHCLGDADFSYTDFTFLSKKNGACLIWQNVLREKLASGFENALLPAVDCLSYYCLSSFAKSVCKRFPAEISSSIPGIFNDDADEIVHICSSLLLQGLRSHALSLPDFVVTMLVQIDKQIDSSSKSAFYLGSYGAHALMHLASLYISDTSYLEKFLSSQLSPAAIAALTEVAKFLLQIGNEVELSADEEEPDETLKVLTNELHAYKACTCMLFSHTENQESDETLYDRSKLDLAFENQTISNEAMTVWTDFSKLLASNSSSLVSQLLQTDANSSFNDQDQNRIASCSELLARWDWGQSLPGCLTSTPYDAAVHLLRHRPEFQENAFLNEEDKEKVEFIKCSFKMVV